MSLMHSYFRHVFKPGLTGVVLFCVSILPAVAYAQVSCRDAQRDSDSAAQEFRKAARSVSQDCRTEDVELCNGSITALNDALAALGQSTTILVDSCDLDVVPPETTPGPGDLVISELQIAVSSGDQWFELFNPTNQAFDLAGLWVEFQDPSLPGSSTIATIAGGVIQPQSFRVVSFDPAILSLYGIDNASPMLSVGGVPTQIALDSEVLAVNSVLGVVDSVGWGNANAFDASEAGIARQLDPDAYDASLNDQVNVPGETNACATPDPLGGQCVWCMSTLTYGDQNTEFYGTPGTENTECPGVGP